MTGYIDRRTNHPPADYYSTPSWATRALLDIVDFRGQVVWDPVCGNFEMENVLSPYAKKIVSSDINYGSDFFNTFVNCDWIVGNPPFNQSADMVERGFEICERQAWLLRLQWLESESRYRRIFSTGRLHRVQVFSQRIQFGGYAGSPMAMAWFIFGRVNEFEEARIGWIPPGSRYDPKQSEMKLGDESSENV